MRLIDADALMKNIGKIPQLRGITYGRMKRAVEETPTVDAEPVRHGRWIPVDGEAPCDEWDCTACGRRMTFMVDMDEDDMAENYWRCPNCGAKMDGGAEDDC